MRKMIVIAAAAMLFSMNARAEGLPGMRGADHIGFTVPNLKQAVDFFVNVIGCKAFYKMGPFKSNDDWMKVHLNVNPRAEIPQIQVVRCGHGSNFEIFEYTAPGQKKAPPTNSDVGGHHIAFYVDDMAAAIAHLKKHGVKVLGSPTPMKAGPSAGETWCYFLAPWGMQLELVTYKNKAYEKTRKDRLWSPMNPGM